MLPGGYGWETMDQDRVPKPRAGFELAELDGESLLYSPDRMTMVYLNESAAAIWRLCDGERTVSEIINMLAEAFPDLAQSIGAEVPELIDRLVNENALELR